MFDKYRICMIELTKYHECIDKFKNPDKCKDQRHRLNMCISSYAFLKNGNS